MLNNLFITGYVVIVNKILKPKSKYVELLNAEEGDRFNLSVTLSNTRRYATYITISNIDKDDVYTTIPQEQFFRSFQEVFDLI